MWKLYKLVNLLFVFVSSYAWFGLLLPHNIIPVLVSAFMVFCYMFGKFNVKVTPRVYGLFGILVLYSMYGFVLIDATYALLTFFSYLPAILLFMLDKPHQKDLLNFVTKWVCIVLGISVFAFIIGKFIPLPHMVFNVPDNNNYLPYDNYFFYLQNDMYDRTKFGGALRFGSVFLEPGHMAMICSLMLFANRYQLKRQPLLWIPLICIGLSYSLVGIVIVIVSLCMLKVRNITSLLLIAIIIAGGWFFITSVWNGGNNPANTMIVERLQFDNEKGIKGNNRTVKQTDYFFRHCVDDGRIITGIGSKDVGDKIRGAGYKIFLLRYGIISLVFVAIIYTLLIQKSTNTRYALSFFAIISLLFLQRAYPSWYSWLFFYVTGLGIMRGEPFFKPSDIAKRPEKKRRKQRRKMPALP